MTEVSITNLARGQIMSPLFVARHDTGADSLYSLGALASEAMAKMAEDDEASGLMDTYDPDTNGNVGEAMVVKLNDGPIMPGETVTMSFDIDDGN